MISHPSLPAVNPLRKIPPKVTGRFEYMQDFLVPGMLHARVVRPQRPNGNGKSVMTN